MEEEPVRHRAIAIGAALAMLATVLAGTAGARNPNCAGGIQYVMQGLADKQKGNLEDYQRELLKAVDRLNMCAAEDPEDLESLAYLGWAYAEIDSACAAGQAFEKAIAGLKAKGDKKAEWATSNRESFWAKNFNEGVADVQAGQAAYPEFTKDPADDGEKALKAEAANKYAAAIAALGRAACLKPGDARTVRNLGTVHMLMGDPVKAESVLRAGLVAAPGDSDLTNALALVRRSYAGKLLDERRYEEAMSFYLDLLKASPSDADLHTGLADAYFKRATVRDDAVGQARREIGSARAGAELAAATRKLDSLTTVRNQDYKAAAGEYASAAQLKPGEADLLFNSALAYQNGGDFASAEGKWREFLQIKPDETTALSAYGSTLAELKRYDEAAAALHKAVNLKPREEKLHSQLGGVYSRADNQPKAYEEMVVYISLHRGTMAESAAEAVKKTPANSDAAKILASLGTPEDVRYWEAEGQKYETWFYWAKNLAYTLRDGQQVAKSDWGAPPPKLEKPAAAAPAKPAAKRK
jgi:Flp pilus assembly protein TadD